jgi:colicin import membrane protein
VSARVVRVSIPFLRTDEFDALLKSAGAHLALIAAFLVLGWLLRPRLPEIHSTRVRLVGALEIPRASRAPSRPATTAPRPEPRVEPRPERPAASAREDADLAPPGVEPRRAEDAAREERRRKPRPRPAPATAASASAEGSSAPAGPPGAPGVDASAGLAASVEGGADGLPDFYLDEIVRKVSARWLKPMTGLPPSSTIVYFEISRVGRITSPRLERASGSALFDRAALRAVELAAPFGPLPKSRASGILKVHFEFTP